MPETLQAPVLAMPEAPNFIVANGKTYLLEEVPQSPEHLLKHVEEFYRTHLEVLQDRFTQHVSVGAQDELDAQIRRVERHLAQGVVSIPTALRDRKILWVTQNRAYEPRLLLFRPNVMTISLQRLENVILGDIESRMTKKEQERFSRFVEWGKPLAQHMRSIQRDISAMKVDIKFNQDFICEAMVAAYVPEEGSVRCIPDTVHPHVHSGGKLCTGNSEPEVFWNEPGFATNFQRLNPHSWANSSTECAQQHLMFLRNQYFTEANIRGEETTGWRTS